jgi:hypothetical protein
MRLSIIDFCFVENPRRLFVIIGILVFDFELFMGNWFYFFQPDTFELQFIID